MATPSMSKAWQRLSRAEIVNFVITSLILNDLDPNENLVADGIPGSILETTIHGLIFNFDGGVVVTGPQMAAMARCEKIAASVGYKGNLREFPAYLRSLPEKVQS